MFVSCVMQNSASMFKKMALVTKESKKCYYTYDWICFSSWSYILMPSFMDLWWLVRNLT